MFGTKMHPDFHIQTADKFTLWQVLIEKQKYPSHSDDPDTQSAVQIFWHPLVTEKENQIAFTSFQTAIQIFVFAMLHI